MGFIPSTRAIYLSKRTPTRVLATPKTCRGVICGSAPVLCPAQTQPMASLRSDAGLSAADLRRREFGAAEAGRRGGGGAERGASKKGQKPERHRYMHTVVDILIF